MTIGQLSLSLALDDAATFENFYTGGNAALLSALTEFLEQREEQFMYLCGPHGCGCSHILQAACHARHMADDSAMYLSLGQANLTPAIFEGLEQMSLLCLDDIDTVLGNESWEEGLFHLYNRMRDAKTQLLVSAKQLPSKLNNGLADLRSRLCWGLVYQVTLLTDTEKYASLQWRANRRGFALNNDVCAFLLRHYPRDTHALYDLLDLLDEASLRAKRKITIPFVKEVMTEAKLNGLIN